VSIGSILSVARTALNAHQTVIQTAGHNIANAETAGYTRQRVDLAPGHPERWPYGSVGTGVFIDNVTRARDELLDVSYRREASGAAASSLRHELLGSVEAVLGEPAEDGLAAAMDAFWSSWSDLANNPTSAAARSVVQQRGAAVTRILNSFDGRLTDIRQQASLRLDNAVTEVNTLSDQIATLNGRIVEAEVGGKSANDLRDERDRAIDSLAKFGDLRVIPNRDGSVQVVLGSNTMVDGISTRRLAVTETAGTFRVHFENSGEPMLPIGGSVTGMVDFLNEDLADLQGRLDALASSLASQVNTQHRLGQTFDGSGTASAAGDFFHPGDPDLTNPPALLPVTARNLRLSDAVLDSATAIAASAAAPGPGQVAGPGNNEIALALAGFRTAPATVSYVTAGGVTETDSFADFYRESASRLGTQVKDAESSAAVHSTLADQAERRRISTSGVNMDEELTMLMRAQQAYAAAAKVISAADEMMRVLAEMV
jgi:flagellar hook-associated protein 1